MIPSNSLLNRRDKIKERGASTIIGLGRHFAIVNDNRDGVIDEREFSKVQKHPQAG